MSDASKIKPELQKQLEERLAALEKRVSALEEKRAFDETESYVHCD